CPAEQWRNADDDRRRGGELGRLNMIAAWERRSKSPTDMRSIFLSVITPPVRSPLPPLAAYLPHDRAYGSLNAHDTKKPEPGGPGCAKPQNGTSHPWIASGPSSRCQMISVTSPRSRRRVSTARIS